MKSGILEIIKRVISKNVPNDNKSDEINEIDKINNIEQFNVLYEEKKYLELLNLHRSYPVELNEKNSLKIASSYFHMREFDFAIEHFQICKNFNAKNYFYRLYLARSYRALERNNDAAEEFKGCIEHHPSRADEVLVHVAEMISSIPKGSSLSFLESKLEEVLQIEGLSITAQDKISFFLKNDQIFKVRSKSGFELFQISDVKNLDDRCLLSYQELAKPEPQLFLDPVELKHKPLALPQPYLSEIKNAVVTGGASTIRVRKKAVWDILASESHGRFVNVSREPDIISRRDDALLMTPTKPSRTIDQCLFLTGQSTSSFGHWYAEHLPRLQFYIKHSSFTSLPILVDSEMPPSHYEFLKALAPNQLIKITKGESLLVRKLILAPNDNHICHSFIAGHTIPEEAQPSFPIGMLRYLKENFSLASSVDKVPSVGSRLFLSRKKTKYRKLINEAAVIEELAELKFEEICIEDYSFSEQVRIFRNAEAIIAPNGSSLFNLVFAPKSVKILILGQKKLFNWGGWFGAHVDYGYSMTYLAGQTDSNNAEKQMSYYISAEKIKNVAADMLKNEQTAGKIYFQEDHAVKLI